MVRTIKKNKNKNILINYSDKKYEQKKIYTRTCIYFRIFKQYKMQTKRSQHGGHTEGRTVKADPFIDRKKTNTLIQSQN